ncbi:MAG: FtsX-like permease family protein [Pseudomonadales bacterium]
MIAGSFIPGASRSSAIPLAFKLLKRKPDAAQLLFLASLLFAVTLVCGMLLFTSRVERAIYRENSALLAADLQIESSRPFEQVQIGSWQRLADDLGLRSQHSVELASMLFFNGELLLCRVRAVGPGYPLRGQLLTAPDLDTAPEVANATPARGEIWLDARAARQLGAQPGDAIELGHLSLRFARVLGAEPGSILPSLGLAGSALFNIDDLVKTGLIVPGSRASWRWMLAGEQDAVSGFAARLRGQLQSHQRLRSNEAGSENNARVVGRALDYLNLGAGVALLMAMLASLVAGREFIASEQRSVTIFKALGFGGRAIVGSYALFFLAWWLGATLLGCLLALFLVSSGFEIFAPALEVPAVSPWQPMLLASLVALGVAAGFVLPALRALARVAPQRLLRQSAAAQQGVVSWLLLPLAVVLLALLGGSWSAAVILLLSTLALALLSWGAVFVALRVLQRFLVAHNARPGGGISLWRLGCGALLRQRRASELRVVALSTTLALLVVVVGLRDRLLDTWRAELPVDAPNFFAVNIPADRAAEWAGWLADRDVASQGAFAVARARLDTINERPAAERIELHAGNDRSLAREFVMTQSSLLPLGNDIVEGRWHAAGALADDENSGNPAVSGGRAEVSAEQGIAERLGLQLGDRLRFMFAGQPLDVELTSVRSLNWDSMQPNFYFILAEPQLQAFPHSYMGSFYLAPDREAGLTALVEAFPEMTLIDLAAIIAQLQQIIARAALAVQMLAILTIVGSILVVATSLQASLLARMQEQRLLRALGAGARELRRIAWVELGLSGLLAGLVGCAIGSALLLLLARQSFDLILHLSVTQLLWQLALAVLLVLALGELMLRSVYRVSPIQAWRKLI